MLVAKLFGHPSYLPQYNLMVTNLQMQRIVAISMLHQLPTSNVLQTTGNSIKLVFAIQNETYSHLITLLL